MPNKSMSADNQTEKRKGSIVAIIVASIAGILTPGAYLLGYSYYEGYMNAFGVEIEGFPVSAPNIYIFSYQTVGYFLLSIGFVTVKALNKLMNPPTIYLASVIFFILVGIIYWLLKAAQNNLHPRLRKIFEKIKVIISWLHWKNNDFTKSVGIIGVGSYSLILLLAATGAIALFWWALPLSAYAKGKEVANDRIKLFLEKGCHADKKSKWDNCFFVVDGNGNKIYEGLLITMNDNVVAIFKKDGSYVFKRKDGFVLHRELH